MGRHTSQVWRVLRVICCDYGHFQIYQHPICNILKANMLHPGVSEGYVIIMHNIQ